MSGFLQMETIPIIGNDAGKRVKYTVGIMPLITLKLALFLTIFIRVMNEQLSRAI